MISEDEVDTTCSGDVNQPPPQPPQRAVLPQDLPVTWYPSEVLLEGIEGHSLTPPEPEDA